jgi:hypothetical protein
MFHRLSTPLRAAAIAGSILIVLGVAGVASGAGSGGGGKATSGTAWLAATPRSSSGLVYYAGFNSDRLLGPGAVTYTIKPTATKSGTIIATAKKVTVWTSNGTLSGTGTATLTITNKPKPGDDTVTGGKLRLTHGTGGQAGHSLVGTFAGKGNISSGSYVFHYKGTYKLGLWVWPRRHASASRPAQPIATAGPRGPRGPASRPWETREPLPSLCPTRRPVRDWPLLPVGTTATKKPHAADARHERFPALAGAERTNALAT